MVCGKNKLRVVISFRLIIMLLMILPMGRIMAQDKVFCQVDSDGLMKKVSISFEMEKTVVNPFFDNNSEQLVKLVGLLKEASLQDEYITIYATASPDGNRASNVYLASQRALQIENYIRKHYVNASGIKIKTISDVSQWKDLIPFVENDPEVPNRDVVLSDLSHIDVTFKDALAARWRLKLIGVNQESWRYIADRLLPKLRNSNVKIYLGNHTLEDIKAKAVEESSAKIETDTIQASHYTDVSDSITTSKSDSIYIEKLPEERKPVLALKTNLLYDALSILNFEIEVPIGDRWSIAGEWIFPWWTSSMTNPDSKRNTLQILNGNLEGKYWFGNRSTRPVMTGWFAGLYAGAGLYDLEYRAEGYQGEVFIMGGLSGGYAHTINKRGNLRMEYSLGVGYMNNQYRYYKSVYESDNRWHSYRHETNDFNWFGPTKAKVSLVWMLNSKKK